MVLIKVVLHFTTLIVEGCINLYRHTLFTPLYATRGSFGPGNI